MRVRGNRKLRVLRPLYVKAPRVDFDPHDDCWYIYVYDWDSGAWASGVNWWPLRWLKFATAEAAETHLQTVGPQ